MANRASIDRAAGVAGEACESGVAFRTKPTPRTLRIMGVSFVPSILAAQQARLNIDKVRFSKGFIVPYLFFKRAVRVNSLSLIMYLSN